VDLVVEFLPFLLLLYLVDSAFFVRSGDVLFVSQWNGRFVDCHPGLRFPGLRPSAEAHLTRGLPLRVSAEGLRIPARGGGRFVPFADMRPVTAASGEVRLDGKTAFTVRPPALAAEVARILERLRTTPASRRHARLQRELRRRCDLHALDSLRGRWARSLPLLKALSWSCALAMAVVLPASLIGELRWRPSPLLALTLVAALYLATVVASFVALRRCGLGRRAALSAISPLLLFPPGVAHAPSLVARELLLPFEPHAVAARLLDRAGFARLTRVADGAEAAPDGCWDVAALVRKLVRLSAARDSRVSPRPVPSDASASAYCPSCLAEYRAGFSRCSDCDVALVPYVR
jgi:hypothetical protein